MTLLEYSDLNTLSHQIQQILRHTGSLLMSYFRGSLEIRFKSRFDMVTEADIASENAIISSLRSISPDIDILAEESCQESKSIEYSGGPLWVLDPLDGTTNFAHGLPHFAISLALLKESIPVLGLVYNPVQNEMFTAIIDHGAYLNNEPIRPSSSISLEKSVVATGFPYKVRELKQNNLMEFCAFRLECQGVRRFGSAALDLAYVACGRLDGFWERWLRPWDTAAGVLLVTEAGGSVSRFDGSAYSIFHSDVVASNGTIHQPMLDVLKRPLPELPTMVCRNSE